MFATNYGSGQSAYVYHTQPYQILYNDNLKWQRNRNSEVGVDLRIGGTSISLVGYFNRTKYPYKLSAAFEPFSYNMMGVPSALPDGTAYTMPANPAFRVDSQTGEIFVRDKDNPSAGWIAMQTTSTKRTFVKNTYQNNGSPVDRMGLEFVVEFPQINPCLLYTSDAADD